MLWSRFEICREDFLNKFCFESSTPFQPQGDLTAQDDPLNDSARKTNCPPVNCPSPATTVRLFKTTDRPIFYNISRPSPNNKLIELKSSIFYIHSPQIGSGCNCLSVAYLDVLSFIGFVFFSLSLVCTCYELNMHVPLFALETYWVSFNFS